MYMGVGGQILHVSSIFPWDLGTVPTVGYSFSYVLVFVCVCMFVC